MTPLADNVILEELEKRTEYYLCKVLAVGSGFPTVAGRLKPQVEAGDVVLIPRFPITRITDPDNPKRMLFLVREGQIRLKDAESCLTKQQTLL